MMMIMTMTAMMMIIIIENIIIVVVEVVVAIIMIMTKHLLCEPSRCQTQVFTFSANLVFRLQAHNKMIYQNYTSSLRCTYIGQHKHMVLRHDATNYGKQVFENTRLTCNPKCHVDTGKTGYTRTRTIPATLLVRLSIIFYSPSPYTTRPIGSIIQQ